jgi:hypothetical protein
MFGSSITGVDLLGFFAHVSLPEKLFGTRHKIQMRDQPVFRKVFCACITVKIKINRYLGAVIFLGSEIF